MGSRDIKVVAARKWDTGLTEMMQHTGGSAEQGKEMFGVLIYHVILAITTAPDNTPEQHLENAIFTVGIIYNLLERSNSHEPD
jgi:hypothetical protein